MVKFSGEQQAIIDAGRSNILVSAAAGSGKTTVLAARITSKIINKELDIDELLVVTFTKDAASQVHTHKRKAGSARRQQASCLPLPLHRIYSQQLLRVRLHSYQLCR